MIKVGIIGAASKDAGELIRILVNHPDVEISVACEPTLKGQRLSSVHHGLIGDSDLVFSDEFDADELNLLFICSKTPEGDCLIKNSDITELCIIDMCSEYCADYSEYDIVYGLSEINRKPLVRGAKKALIPDALASVSLISLLPILNHNLLNDNEITINFTGDFSENKPDSAMLIEELKSELKKIQNDFKAELTVKFESEPTNRAVRTKIDLDCRMSLDEIEKIYEDTYDDHNLTYILSEPASFKEVEGTDKCLISLTKTEEGLLHIDALTDRYLRGGAGDAVHVMNLLFGLHERTGLNLKASCY